jgi:DNA-binding response OmpR family regulator
VNTIISDTGIGIPKEKLSKIFDRFYQVDGSHTREQEGTGIGLALTKELVELHKGKIEVESQESKGTIFTVRIPLGKEHLKPEEIIEKDQEYENKVIKVEFDENIQKKVRQKIDTELFENESLPLLLIVEDNSDVRNYIKDNLKKDYRILEAVDGEDGWNKSIEQIPDLIVSDVMMPKMDGFKLCEKLKTDERTSHIPVILLTAKASKEDKLEGYETGADEYLMKPFEPDELRARIKNLIEQRKRLHKHFQIEGIFKFEQTNITSIDKKFMQRIIEVIKDNISNAEFNVEMLTENIAVSRSLLNKKVVSLTGEPPKDLIRRIRLKKAAELIEKKFGNLSEIALEVGFDNPAYFSECFKKQFGVPPSQYQRNNKTS